jgi:hypothetical protein
MTFMRVLVVDSFQLLSALCETHMGANGYALSYLALNDHAV